MFLAAAARRYFSVLAFSEAPLALTLLLAVAVLLLIAGTFVITTTWLFAAAVLGIALAAFRMRGRWLSRYRLAQIVDRRLRLNDSISTAWFLLTEASPQTDTAEFQLSAAQGVIRSLQPSQAFPFEWKRNWLLPAALSLVALSLFLLRVGRSPHVDLRPSLVPVSIRNLLASRTAEAKELRQQTRKPNRVNPEQLGLPDQPGIPGEERNTQNAAGQSPNGMTPGSEFGANSSPRQEIEKLQEQQERAAEQQRESSNSLLNKMQTALGGLMTKMQQALKPGDARAQKDSQSGQQSTKEEKDSQPGEADSKSASQQANSSQGQHGETNGNATNAQPQAVEKSSGANQLGTAKQPANESGDNSQSGAGRNDGQKKVQDADELRALGKLEEIVGKRSAAVTGDMKIEKSSGKQQLQTDYTNEVARHSDRGGPIDRDEIPPEYRAYIRAYMEAMRKQEPAPPVK